MIKTTYPILTYHSISIPPKHSKIKSICVSKARFKLHMLILKTLGYQAISMRELVPYLKGEKTGKVLGLTFDDGYLDNHTHAIDILKKFKFTATCYIVTDNIGEYNKWDIDKGVSKKKLMNITELKQWMDAGFELGSHTLSHQDLTKCDNQNLLNEISDSKSKLELLFNTTIESFCFPYGKFNQEALSIIELSGYSNATTTSRGSASTKDNLYTLPRINIAKRTGVIKFLIKLLTNYEKKRKHK